MKRTNPKMKKTYYLVEVQGGVEPFVQGLYRTKKERDDAAKQVHEAQEEDDCLFWADVDTVGRLIVGPYSARFFWK